MTAAVTVVVGIAVLAGGGQSSKEIVDTRAGVAYPGPPRGDWRSPAELSAFPGDWTGGYARLHKGRLAAGALSAR